ncbi:hypothetical protein OSB04_016632 [Centaurea solstitialis]|uniref:Polyprotein n=1 Tax=Centaurea solstitialis TaxID=347529 RepID=A0AA38W9Z6_9ASTR|nr:hypothetical protein OSB04_016632 [Centaurea solstitialis]
MFGAASLNQFCSRESDVQSVSVVEAWKHSEFRCRNYVLNGLADPLYSVYCKVPTAKELWESVDRKYKTEDAGTKKHVVARFLEFKILDSKTVMSQVQDLQVILLDILIEGMILRETFHVAAMIEKLPLGWIDFKNYLKHKRKKMSVEELVVHLHIEEDNRKALKGGYNAEYSKMNVVEEGQSSKAKGKGTFKKKFKCYNCGQAGHKAADCKQPKKENPRQANMMNEELVAMITDFSSMMISEVNMIGANAKEWWVDTGATRHVCYDKNSFHTFKEVNDDQKMFMGNAATAEIKGIGEVVLKMTSGQELKLKDVLFVLELRKNLTSGCLLNKVGFKLVFESDKFVLSKGGMYVGKGYAMNGMFKLNVMVVNVMNTNASTSAYMLEFSNIWHRHLGHVNFHSIQRLSKLNCIPNCDIDLKHKCPVCVEAKLTRTSFLSVDRKIKPLDLIHTDVCELKSIPTRGGNKYFITFIDDSTKVSRILLCFTWLHDTGRNFFHECFYSQYCFTHRFDLQQSKDEAIDKFMTYKTKDENQLNKKIKILRSDRGGEYVSPFAEFCSQNRIRHEFTTLYSPQQNGIAEMKNRTLKEMPLEICKFTGSNFLDWERNLQIVLRHERKWPELQTGLMNTNAYDMIRQLRDMFQTQAHTERYDATRALNACKMAKGTSVSAHVMEMKKHINHLERLGHPVPLQLATDTILNSLSDDYKQFVINYNMNNMDKTVAELHSMLKTAELSMGTKTKDVLMVRDGGVKNKHGHGNTGKGQVQVVIEGEVPRLQGSDMQCNTPFPFMAGTSSKDKGKAPA